MQRPLDGVRIIDWTIWQQGPVATMMLGDLGAEVIKIEPVGRGDTTRMLGKLHNGESPMFTVLNRNKQLVGIVSLGDLAVDTGDDQFSGEILERVSERGTWHNVPLATPY